MLPPTPGWRLAPGFDWHQWDGDVVVRSRRGGATFALSESASAVLIAIGQGALGDDEIEAALGEHAATDATGGVVTAHGLARQALHSTLHQLEALGLVALVGLR